MAQFFWTPSFLFAGDKGLPGCEAASSYPGKTLKNQMVALLLGHSHMVAYSPKLGSFGLKEGEIVVDHPA